MRVDDGGRMLYASNGRSLTVAAITYYVVLWLHAKDKLDTFPDGDSFQLTALKLPSIFASNLRFLSAELSLQQFYS